MSDNVTQLNLKPRKPGIFKRILIFLVVLLAVCAAVLLFVFRDSLNIDGVRRWIKYLNVRDGGSYGVYSFDAHNSNRYAAFQNGLAVASVGGLELYDENGEEVLAAQAQLELPELATGKKLAMVYDVGGTTLLAVHKSSGEVLRLETDKPILDADLSSGDAICYSTSASGYKSVLSVYNSRQELIYRWLSSTIYMPLCAISDDARDLAAVGLGQSDGSFESTLYLFRTDSEDLALSVSLGSELIYDIFFLDSQTICAVGEASVRVLSLEGEILGSYAYSDLYLKDFDAGGDGFLTLSLNMYKAGNRYSLVTVDDAGNEIASLYLGQELLDLSACGKYAAVLTSGGLTVYNRDLTVYYETAETGAATSVLMREDGSVLLLGGGEGSLYIP